MNKDKIAVAIIDDHTLFRDGLVRLLADTDEVSIIFDAGNGREMISKISGFPEIDVILMDVHMPVMDGVSATLWLKQNYPHIKILTLSMFDDDHIIIKMLKNGASGYVLKESKLHELVMAIKNTYQHGVFFNDLVSAKVLKSINGVKSLTDLLSQNQKRFLQLCCSELTYREIADTMNLSPHTIDNYRQQLFDKFSIKSRTGLALFAIKNHLAEA